VAQSPEEELSEFLAPLPHWLQKILWHDHSHMTDLEISYWNDSINPFTADELQGLKIATGWQPERYPHTAEELRPRFEQLLQHSDPAEWERYCGNAKAARNASADLFVPMPRGKPGRKRNDKLAARIRALSVAGKKSREIQAILQADGVTLSVEAVEAYLKKRRRPREQ